MRSPCPLAALVLSPLLSLGLGPEAPAQSFDCGSATPIAGEGVFPFDNTGAPDTGQFTCVVSEREVYWLWTAPASGRFLVEFVSSFSGTLEVFRAPFCAFTNPVASNCEQFAPGGVLIPNAAAGEPFLVVAAGFFGDSGAGAVEIRRPPCDPGVFQDDAFEDNDTIGTAAPIAPGLITGITIAIGDEDWHAFTVPAGMRFEAEVIAAPFEIATRAFAPNGTALVDQTTGASYDPQSPAPFDVVLRLQKTPSPYLSGQCATYDLDLRFRPSFDPRFSSFCTPADPNSTGFMAQLFGFRAGSDTVLRATWGPDGAIGYFLVSATAQSPGVAVGSGHLCLGAPVGRYLGPGTPLHSVGIFDGVSFVNLSGTGWSGMQGFVVPNQLPAVIGGAIQPGETWSFQLWHRDVGGTSNFTNGVSVTF